MPSKDTHYNLAGAMFKLWGHKQDVVNDAAWADQMTDECTPENLDKWNLSHLGLFPTQCYDYDWWQAKTTDPRVIIWKTYHFPYGQDLALHNYEIQRDIQLLHEFLKVGTREASIAAGILAHRIFDGLASHSYFLGWKDVRNEKPEISVDSVIPPIGHAQYISIVDEIDTKVWKAPNGVKVNNKDLWVRAAKQMWPAEAMDKFPEFEKLIRAYMKKDRIKAANAISGIPPFKVGDTGGICLFLYTAKENILGL